LFSRDKYVHFCPFELFPVMNKLAKEMRILIWSFSEPSICVWALFLKLISELRTMRSSGINYPTHNLRHNWLWVLLKTGNPRTALVLQLSCFVLTQALRAMLCRHLHCAACLQQWRKRRWFWLGKIKDKLFCQWLMNASTWI